MSFPSCQSKDRNLIYSPTNLYSHQYQFNQISPKNKVNHTAISFKDYTNANQRHLNNYLDTVIKKDNSRSSKNLPSNTRSNFFSFRENSFKYKTNANVPVSLSCKSIYQNENFFSKNQISFNYTSSKNLFDKKPQRFENIPQEAKFPQYGSSIIYQPKPINKLSQIIKFQQNMKIIQNQKQNQSKKKIQYQGKLKQLEKQTKKQKAEQASSISENSQTPTVNKNISQKRTREFQNLEIAQNAQNFKKYSQIISINKENPQEDRNFEKKLDSNRLFKIQKVFSIEQNLNSSNSQAQKNKNNFNENLNKFQIFHLKSEINRIKFENAQLKQVNKRNIQKINQYKFHCGQITGHNNNLKTDYLEIKQMQQVKNLLEIKNLNNIIENQKNQISNLLSNKIQNQKIIENLKQNKDLLKEQILLLKQEFSIKNAFQSQIHKMTPISLINQDKDQMENKNIHCQLSQYEKLFDVKKNIMKYSFYSNKSKDGEQDFMNPEQCYFEVLDLFGIQKTNENSLNILIKEITQLKQQLEEVISKYQNLQNESNFLKQNLKLILLQQSRSSEKKVMDCFNILKQDDY